jgi:hypothetical protein
MDSQSQGKIEAIYDLREAVEEKVRAEVAVDKQPTSASRDRLLDATLAVEEKTQHAIEVCHECGHQVNDAPHVHRVEGSNVIAVDFGADPATEGAEKS